MITTNRPLVKIEKVYKNYEGPRNIVNVLKGVDLQVEQGETVAIMGDSGVGKSTLLHIAGALDKPTSGRIFVGEKELFRLNKQRLATFRNRNIGFIFQFHHLLPEFSALENVMMPVFIARQDRTWALNCARVLLAEVGLTHRENHRISELSGGEAQRVAVARALILNPRLLLADEPTGNLDEHTGKKIRELILRLNIERGLTVLLATHSEQLANGLKRRVKLINGKIYPLL